MWSRWRQGLSWFGPIPPSNGQLPESDTGWHVTNTPDPQGLSEESFRPISNRVILFGLALGHSVFHWIVQSFVVVLPEIQQAFLLNAVGVGGILAARELATGLVKLPAGVVADMLREHWGSLLAACLMASAVGAFLIGVSPGYYLVLIGIVIVAVSHSIWHLPSSASLSYHFRQRRAVALATHGVGGSVGDVVGPVATGALLAFLTWRQLLSIYAVAPLILGVVALGVFRNIGRTKEKDPVATSQRAAVTRRLLRTPVLWGLALVYGLRAMALVALVTVLPLYLDNELALSTVSRGFHIGLLIVIGLIAKPVAGYLSDRLGRKQVLVPGLVWSCLVALTLTIFDTGISLTITIALMGLFLYPDQPILTATVFDMVGREVANTALGVVSFISTVLVTLSPIAAGALYQSLGFDATAFYIAALFATAAILFSVLPMDQSLQRPAE